MGQKQLPNVTHGKHDRPITLPENVEYPIHVKSKYPYKGNTNMVVGFYAWHACNVRCDYCFWFRDIDLTQRMQPDNWKRIISEIGKREHVHLLFLGGEPTFNKELPDMITYAVEEVGITDLAIGTNFTRPLDYFKSLPHQDICKVNITLHPDMWKDKPDEEYYAHIDKIVEYTEYTDGVRLGVMIDERYMDRVFYALEKFKDIKIMKYPVIPTYETYEYYKVSPENIEKVKPYFHQAFTKYKINNEERDWLDDHHNDGPVFTGYWCNANTLEVFANGDARITCLDKVVGNVIEQDDVIKNHRSLVQCTAKFCDNFNRVLLKKWKYTDHGIS
jgi:organic radical activating enzyme